MTDARCLLAACLLVMPAAAFTAPPEGIAFEPPIGERVPPDLSLCAGDVVAGDSRRIARDAGSYKAFAGSCDGSPTTLGQLLDNHRRTVLVPVWYHCRRLCDVTLESLARGVRSAPPGTQVLVYSISPDETAADAANARRTLLARHPQLADRAGWRFAVLPPPAIERLSTSIGFRFDFDAGHAQYRHAAGAVVLDDRGTQRAFLPGPAIRPDELERALADARPPAIARIASFCFTYDPQTGRYSFSILRTVRWLGLLTVLVVAALAARALFRERRRKEAAKGPEKGAAK